MPDLNQVPSQTTPVPANTTPPVASPQAGRFVEPPAISGNREHGPISTAKSEFAKPVEVQSEIAPSTPPEIMIPQELKNRVEKGPDAHQPKIEKETRLAGMELAKESTPVITTPTGIIHLPLTYTQALQKKKESRLIDSIHWLAALVMYQWRKYDPDNIKKSG